MILALRILYFEDLSVGMTETLSKTIAASDVVGFAQLTGDRNPIHLSEHFAAKTQFGIRIAHGLYTLSLGPKFSYEMFNVDNVAFGINYGYEKIRFPAPVPVDSKVRMRAELLSVDDIPGGVQFKVKQTYEIEGAEKPACVAEALARVYGG